MAIINSYTRDTDIKNSDVFIGTKFSNRQTVNFTAQTVADYLNINGKISIAGQMLWKFVVINPGNGTMSFEGGGGEGEPFEDITELILSKTDGSGQFVNIFLDYLVDTQILLSQQSTINQFGHYKIVSYAVQPDPNFYKLTLEFIGGNGGLIKDAYYDMASFSISSDTVIPTLQTVTDAGATTTNPILALAGLKSSEMSTIDSDILTLTAVGTSLIIDNTTETITAEGNMVADKFIKLGGTSSQYLMADGSVTTGGGDYIPLTGTIIGSPVSGDIQVSEGIKIAHNAGSTESSIFFGASLARTVTYNTTNFSYLTLEPTGLTLSSTSATSKGISGIHNYSANITDLDYTQKIYVDTAIGNITTPTLQEVTAAGASTTNIVTITSSVTDDTALTLINSASNGAGVAAFVNGGFAVAGYSNYSASYGVYGANATDGIGVEGTSGSGIAISGKSSDGKSAVFNNLNPLNTSNIVEFQKDNINQASISHDGKITSNAFIKIGGTSSQFLKADGTVDSTTYISSVPTLQQVSDAGRTVNYYDSGMVINIDDADYYGFSGLTINAVNNATGINVISESNGIVSYTSNGNAIVAYSDNGASLVANLPISSTSNIAEFKKDWILQASISHDGEITANKFIKELGVSAQFLKADGSVDNNVYLTSADLPSTLDLFATTTADTLIPGYTVLVRNILDPRYNTVAVDVPTGDITTTNQLLSSLITDTNVISGEPGVFNFTTIGNIRRVGGSGEATFYFRIYKRSSLGVETFITQSDNTLPVIDGGLYVEFSAVALWNDGLFLSTDRIVVKYYANRISGGSDPSYEFQFGGLTPVRSTAAVPVAVLPNIYLSNLVDVEDVPPLPNEILYWNDTASLWEHSLVNDLLVMPTLQEITDAGSTTTNTITTAGFIKTGGTSSEFLKADGSVDSNTYLTSSSNYWTKTGDDIRNNNIGNTQIQIQPTKQVQFLNSAGTQVGFIDENGTYRAGTATQYVTVGLLGGNTWMSMVRIQASMGIILGNPQVSQAFVTTSTNYFGSSYIAGSTEVAAVANAEHSFNIGNAPGDGITSGIFRIGRTRLQSTVPVKYATDLSASYDDRTLVDKAYADTKQSALSGTGFVKSTAGVISYDTSTYITGNQSITLSGAVTGTGTTAITTSLSNSVVGIANLTATGTPSATTYLRGDNTWATVAGGGGSPGGTVNEVQYNDGAGGFAGAANVEIATGNLKLVSTTDPSTPTGGLIYYSKVIAGRVLPKIIGPSGIDTVMQVGLHGNSVFLIAPANATTAPTVTGGVITTAATISHQQTIASSAPWQATRRTRFQTSTTAGNATGARTAYTQWYRGSVTGFGGFWFRAQLGMNINLQGGQKFVGLCNSTGVLAGDPSALLNMCGMGYDAADLSTGNWFFMYNDGTGAATKVDLGANAVRNTTTGYDLIMYMAPGGSELFVRIVNIATNVIVLETSYTTLLPVANTGMAFKAEVRNGAVAAADNIEIAKVYIETDY